MSFERPGQFDASASLSKRQKVPQRFGEFELNQEGSLREPVIEDQEEEGGPEELELDVETPEGRAEIITEIDNVAIDTSYTAQFDYETQTYTINFSYGETPGDFVDSPVFEQAAALYDQIADIEAQVEEGREVPDKVVEALERGVNVFLIDAEPMVLTEPVPTKSVEGTQTAEVALDTTELYGITLPQAGSDKRFGAITFGKAIDLAIYRDTEALAVYPEKKRLLGKVMQIVRDVPEEGLDDEDIDRLQSLAEQINELETVPESKSRQATGTKFENPGLHSPEVQKDIDDARKVAGNFRLLAEEQKRAKLELVPEEEDDRSLAITDASVKKIVNEENSESKTTVSFSPSYEDIHNHEMDEYEIAREMSDDELEYGQQGGEEILGQKMSEYSAELQKVIRSEVGRIERKGSDKLDSWFNSYQSPYTILGDISYEDIVALSQLNYFELKQNLDTNRVKYEVFDEWKKQFAEIAHFVPDTTGKTFKQVVDEYIVAQQTS